MTNLLIEGGGTTLGAFFDADLIDEFHVFVSPKLIGSRDAISPLAGLGRAHVSPTPDVVNASIRILDGDVYYNGRYRRESKVEN